MSPRIRSEVFIQTLEEMRDHERDRKKARLHMQLKAHVKRFVEEFRSDFNGDRHASEWIPQGRQTAQDAGRQFRDD